MLTVYGTPLIPHSRHRQDNIKIFNIKRTPGIFTVAHCAAPRKMNGKDYEPAKIMTHFESDYGAATKVDYTKGQIVTAIIPNLRCSKWQGFRGKVLDSPSHPARSA